MKTIKNILILTLALPVLLWSCQEEDFELGDITAPSNVQVDVEIVGADADNPNGDGSGVVNFKATADNALSYQYVFNDVVSGADNGERTYEFTTLGLNSYAVTVIAFGTAGASTSKTVVVDVLSTYSAPPELLTFLTGDGSKSWRIKSEAGGHFGLGPVGGNPFEYYAANAGDKANSGMYDDTYIFNIDGTYQHIVNSENDADGTNPEGTVFGRDGLVQELGGVGGGTADGADILNYAYTDYTGQWSLSAPGGVETISLTGIGFIGYYTGGDHRYQILNREGTDLVIKTTDGNGEFDWGFTLTPQ